MQVYVAKLTMQNQFSTLAMANYDNINNLISLSSLLNMLENALILALTFNTFPFYLRHLVYDEL